MLSPRFALRVKAALLVVAAALAASCSSLKHTAAAQGGAEPRFQIEIRLDKGVYRPGEMIVCALEVRNLQDRPARIVPPFSRRSKNESTLGFWRRLNDEGGEIVRRAPIEIPSRPAPPVVAIETRGTLTEKFAFVNLTEKEGDFSLQAHYNIHALEEEEGASSMELAVSSATAARFEVKGERLWRRDRDGLIVKEDALRAAKARYGDVFKSAHAVLHKNEAGLYDWWVTLERMPYDVGPGETKWIACYTSPYGGHVIETRKAAPVRPKEEGTQSKAQ